MSAPVGSCKQNPFFQEPLEKQTKSLDDLSQCDRFFERAKEVLNWKQQNPNKPAEEFDPVIFQNRNIEHLVPVKRSRSLFQRLFPCCTCSKEENYTKHQK